MKTRYNVLIAVAFFVTELIMIATAFAFISIIYMGVKAFFI